MKSTELHAVTVNLGKIRWGSFELILGGTNTAGSWNQCTVRIEWRLWPMIAQAARAAWLKEEQSRTLEMDVIADSLPSKDGDVLRKQVEERRSA